MPRRNRVQTVHIRRRFFLRNFFSTLSLMLIPVLAVNALLAVYVRGETRGDAERQSLQTLDYMKSSFDMVFDELFYYRNLFVSNSNLNLLLISTLSERPLTYSDAVSLRELYSYMSGLSGIKPSLHSIYFGKADSDKMIVEGLRLDIDGYIDSEWYRLYMAEETGAPYWIERRDIRDYAFETETRPVLTIFQRLKYGGVMVVNLDLGYFDELLQTSTTYEGQALAVLDEYGDIILQNGGVAGLPEGWLEQVSGEGDAEPLKGYQITSLESSRYGLTYLSLIPGSSIYRLSDLIYGLSLLVGGVAVLVSAGFAFLYTRRSYRQISRIIDAFDDAEQGRALPLPSEIREGDAYSYILHNTVNTFLRQSYLEVQLSRRRYEMLSAQLAALQYQINPHFLFNTLQSIDLEISRDRPGSRASRMVGQLSDLLRYSLGDPQELILISDEIAITKGYVEIQQYRHSNRFRVFWDYREECLGRHILRMLLQPLIENVLSHGMKPEEGATTLIRVRIRLEDGRLHFRVTDNGTGISRGRLLEIRAALEKEDSDMEPLHIGLRNIHRRLRIRYPGEPGLRIWSREGLGSAVSFQVPCSGDSDTPAFFPGEEPEE